MKKLNLLLFTALAAVLSITSCKKDEIDPDSFGITALTVATADGTVRQGVIDQNALTITVKMPVTTQASELEECTITATVTMNTTVTIGEDELTGNTFDLTSPVTLSAKNSGVIREYTLTVTCTEKEADLASGKLISADITAGGIPANTYAYSVALYDGKFYAFTASATGDAGAYKVYTSANGKLWSEMNTPEIIGGMGTSPVVYNGKLYAVGGLRAIGNDQDGNAPEIEAAFGTMYSATLKTLRIFSTDGTTWSNESIEGKQDPENMFSTMVFLSMFGFINPHLYEFNNTLYMQQGASLSYGNFQNSNTTLYKFDGTTFQSVQSGTNPAYNTAFVLKGKVFVLGGTRGFVGPETLLSTVSCSEDGENFTQVAETTAIGNICGATVVTNKAGNVAYLFGGLYINAEDGGRTINKNVYRTTDGVEWTLVEGINPDYQGAFRPSVTVDDNDIAYVFGGFNTAIGNYPPYSLTQDDMDPSFAAWAFQIQ